MCADTSLQTVPTMMTYQYVLTPLSSNYGSRKAVVKFYQPDF
jgi:hypothetical protein